jgi:hypothetical protein
MAAAQAPVKTQLTTAQAVALAAINTSKALRGPDGQGQQQQQILDSLERISKFITILYYILYQISAAMKGEDTCGINYI